MFTKPRRAFLAGALAITMAGHAFAHAHLVSATPPADGTVAASPTELDLNFSEVLSLKFSGVKLAGPDKALIATGAASLSGSNESTLVIPIPAALVAGTYAVDWHVLSRDGHKTHGSYTFTVKP